MKLPRSFAYRSFQQQRATVEEFSRLGVDLNFVYPANTLNLLGIPYCLYPANWLHLGIYNWEVVDRQFEDLLKANPAATFFCMVDLNTPTWLVHCNKSVREDTFGMLGKVAGDNSWREQTAEYLQAFLSHVEQKFGDRIHAYILSCGATCEWQDQSKGEESPSRREAWRHWSLAQGHADPIDIPTKSQREASHHGLLRDPVLDAVALRYWDFNRWLIAETILYFSEKAQSVINHRIPLGVFFGYVLEHGRGRLNSEGHLGFDTVFQSPHLDFFVSPISYQDRMIGGSSGFMSPVDSLKLHGKGFIQEIDHYTHTSNSNPFTYLRADSWPKDVVAAAERKSLQDRVPGSLARWPDEASTIAGLRREFSLALISGASLWWFDMWNHWYDSTEVRSALADMKTIWDCETQAAETVSVSEIALIVDAKSCLYLNENDPSVHDVLHTLRPTLGKLGAPYSIFSFADIDKIDFTPYKLIIFPNLFFIDDARRARLDEYILHSGRTVLWIHLAGVISPEGYRESNIQLLTGLPFTEGEIASKQFGNWRSVLHSALKPDISFLRELAATAGVHLYTSSPESIYANEHLLACHSADGGLRQFRLRKPYCRVRELFTNRIVGENCSVFQDEWNQPGTVLYRLEESSDQDPEPLVGNSRSSAV